MEWRQPQFCHPCYISPHNLEELWWSKSSSETPISSEILSWNYFSVKASISGLNFAIRNWYMIVKNKFWTEGNHRYVILVLHLPFVWKSCGGLNHHQRHQDCHKYCLWICFTYGFIFWAYFFHKNWERIVKNEFWTEYNHRSFILVLY